MAMHYGRRFESVDIVRLTVDRERVHRLRLGASGRDAGELRQAITNLCKY